MDTYCGANCFGCPFSQGCKGCIKTCGSPFGGKCVAAEYIKENGKQAYDEFKQGLLEEVNALLVEQGIPEAQGLYELTGRFVNMHYVLPNGEKIKFLDDRNEYLGTQVGPVESGRCYGVAADTTFILICSYGPDGSDPELVLYKKR